MLGDINDSNILTELVQNSEITLEYMQQNITDELGEKLNEKLFEMQTASKMLPICLESAVEYICEQIEVQYVPSQASLTKEQVQQFFDSLVTDAIAVLKEYDETKDLPFLYNF